DSGAAELLDGVDLDARSDTTLPEPDGDATALVLYTSGTTGAPKGVVISRNAVAADLDALAEAWAWTPADVLVHGLPLYHVQVRGKTLFQGYLNRPDATAAAFTADGWLRTGDAAVLSADGSHRIVGRATSDLIKTGGFRVGAGEVEDALLTHPAVREVAVVGE